MRISIRASVGCQFAESEEHQAQDSLFDRLVTVSTPKGGKNGNVMTQEEVAEPKCYFQYAQDLVAYNACYALASATYEPLIQNAPGDWDTATTWTRYYVKYIDLGTTTQQGPLTVTLSASPSGPGTHSLSATLFGYVGFRLTQTPGSFRPRDARDAAAACGDHPGDCKPSFTLFFDATPPDVIGPSAVRGPGRPRPPGVPLRMAGGAAGARRGPVGAAAHSPGQAPGPAASSFQKEDTTPDASPSCTLALEHPVGQTARLKGTSTNFDGGAGPDYVFDTTQPDPNLQAPSADGLTIATAPFNAYVSTSWTVNVNSRDFGGRANVRATCKVPGSGLGAIEAIVVDPVQGNYLWPLPKAGCGANRSTGNYATLPVDEDCNGIADW
jgi:hypothetical protein